MQKLFTRKQSDNNISFSGALAAMSWVKQKKAPVNLDDFEDIDEDALVEALSPEELADLNAAIDPEVRVMIEVIVI